MTKEPSVPATVNPFNKMGSVAVNNPQGMAAALASSASTGMIGQAPGGSDYMNFSGKRGVYEFGQEKEDISPDELWLIDISSFQSGYMCWKNSTPVATRLSSIYGPPVAQPNFEEHGPFRAGDGWSPAKGLVCASVDTMGRQGYFKTSSKTGVGCISGIEDQVAQRMLGGQPCLPLVFWKKEKFQAQGNWNWKPVAEVYGWLTPAAVNQLSDPETDLDQLIADCESGKYNQSLAATSEPAAVVVDEPAVEPEPVDPAPAQVVRRRAAAAAVATPAEPATASALAPGAARRQRRGL